MDIEELTAALADPGHAPEPDAVMAAFERKRRRRGRQRWSMAGGCLAAAATAAVIAAVLVIPTGTRESGVSGADAGAPAGESHASIHGTENGNSPRISAGPAESSPAACAAVPLEQRVASAVGAGGSVVIADVAPHGLAADGRQSIVLTDPRTLRGPHIASGVTGYTVSGFTGGGLTGQVFAIVLPGGEVLTAPVSDGTVRFSGARCWGTADEPLASVEQVTAGQ